MNSELLFGLDLGSEQFVCVAGERGSNGMPTVKAVAKVASAGIRKGVVSDPVAAGHAIRDVLESVSVQIGLAIGPLVVSIAGEAVKGYGAQGFLPIYPAGREITRDDVLQVINHSRQTVLPPGIEQIQVIPREFRVDHQRGVQKPVGMPASKFEVVTLLVTAPSHVRSGYEEAIRNGGGTVHSFVYGPAASGLGVVRPEDLEMGCLVIDLGAEKTEGALFANGSIAHGLYVGVGGRMVTSDISKLLKTSVDEAERLKRESGSARPDMVGEEESVEVLQLGQTHLRPMQRRVLAEIIQSRIREIALMVKEELAVQGVAQLPAGGILLTGSGSLLPGIEKVFDEVFEVKGSRVTKGPGGDPCAARAYGLLRLAAEADEDELATAGSGGWKDRIRTLWSIIGGN